MYYLILVLLGVSLRALACDTKAHFFSEASRADEGQEALETVGAVKQELKDEM